MKLIGIIPARYNSTRFPGKPLIKIQGKSIIQRVYEQACQSNKLTEVVVATDDKRIEEHVKEWGGSVIMTSLSHPSGTDRCYEAIQKVKNAFDVIINIQGDEPFIHPQQIDKVAECFDDSTTQIATLIKKIKNEEDLKNPNVVKVVFNKQKEAVYFSRSIIPYVKNTAMNKWMECYSFYKHIGIYGYRRDILQKITQLSPSSLEQAESLEQLRWVENGYKIKVEITPYESISIDSPEDIQRLADV